MTKLAAIEGQLVSIKNVSTHKSACLTIHVPEEYALKVIEAFGWPTMVAPVHVAIARMGVAEKEPEAEAEQSPQSAGGHARAAALEPERRTEIARNAARKRWGELPIAQQAGIMCAEGGFQKFVSERAPHFEATEQDAAQYVRQQCGVNSRAHIEDKPEALRIFRDLDASYRAWLVAS